MAPWQPDPSAAAIFTRLEHDPDVKRLLSAFCETTGVRLRIAPLCPPSVDDLTEYAREHPFCKAFLAVSEESQRHCLQVHSALRSEAAHATGAVRKCCVAGLFHGAAPVIVRQKPVALLVFGGVANRTPFKDRSSDALRRFLEKQPGELPTERAVDALEEIKRTAGRKIEELTGLIDAVTPWLEKRALRFDGVPDRALPAPLSRAIKYARVHFADGKLASVLVIAKEVEVSPRWLRALFRTHLGMTFAHWLARHRVSVAMARLRGGQDRILDVALACGFSSISSFQRSFRAQTGITPGEYRRGVEPKRSGAGGNEESPRGESNG